MKERGKRKGRLQWMVPALYRLHVRLQIQRKAHSECRLFDPLVAVYCEVSELLLDTEKLVVLGHTVRTAE